MLDVSAGIESTMESEATGARSSIWDTVSTVAFSLLEEQEEVAAASTARSARAEMILVILIRVEFKEQWKTKVN